MTTGHPPPPRRPHQAGRQPANPSPHYLADEWRKLADRGEALAAELVIMFRELQAQRYAPVRVPRAVLERIERLGRDAPAWLESVDNALRQRQEGVAKTPRQLGPQEARYALRVAQVAQAMHRANQTLVRILPDLSLRGVERLYVEWPLFAGIPRAVRRLASGPLPSDVAERLMKMWRLLLEVLRTAPQLERKTPKAQLERLAAVFPGSRGPGGAVSVSATHDGARRAGERLELRPKYADAIHLFLKALEPVLPDHTPKKRLKIAAEKFPATVGAPARDGTRVIGKVPPADVIQRYVKAYRQQHPGAAVKEALHELESLAKGSYRTLERRRARATSLPQ